MPIGVAEPAYEMISESLEALSKIQQNHSAIQQRLPILPFMTPNHGKILDAIQNLK